jgi:hypothetical protein
MMILLIIFNQIFKLIKSGYISNLQLEAGIYDF